MELPRWRWLFWDFGLDLWSRTSCSWTIWSWTINNPKECFKSNMLQEHYLNVHCYRSIFATCTCSWNSVHFKCDSGACLTLFFQIINGLAAPEPYGLWPLIIPKNVLSQICSRSIIWSVHCYRSIFATCSWNSVHFKCDSGACLTLFFQIINGLGPYGPGLYGVGPAGLGP